VKARALVLAVVAAMVWALVGARPASALDHNFAGSAQLDYHYVPKETPLVPSPNSGATIRGFTLEAAAKVAVDFSDHLSANFKLCYGCHGLEVDMVYFDARASDELNLRVGRFSPSFGAFNVRHDPANHLTSDKPLPYDMGRMLRKRDWGNGVLPAPFPSNGVELNGLLALAETTDLEYAAYAVQAFRNDVDPHPTDIDFQESHLSYYLSGDLRPQTGGRLALTLGRGTSSALTLGASGLFGTYAVNKDLTYFIGGTDLSIRVHRTNVRLEYLLRREQFDIGDPAVLKYAVASSSGDFFTKHGAYVEVEQPLGSKLTVLGRIDGLARFGNVGNVANGSGSEAFVPSPLTSKAWVVRETVAFAYAIQRNLVAKASGELWSFNYADELGHKTVPSFHLGAVGSF
jgi:hypothetical protein